MRILVVEDHAVLRGDMARMLGSLEGGSRVDEAANGLEALALLDKAGYDLIVTDIVMPMMDGFSLMEALRKRATSSPKIIVTTALSRDDFIARAMELGADFFLAKPYDPEALLSCVRRLRGGYIVNQVVPVTVSLEDRLDNLLITLGIPPHVTGYAYLREGVLMAAQRPALINRMTKALYPGIAERLGSTPSKVERAIRHAIGLAWNHVDVEAVNACFGCRAVTREIRPSNSELIALLAQKLASIMRRAQS